MPVISAESVVVASKDQVSSDLAGETVLLSMRTAHYYGVADVGARIWQLLQEPVRASAICDAIASEYDVTRDRCEIDVLRFLDELHANGLIEVDGGS